MKYIFKLYKIMEKNKVKNKVMNSHVFTNIYSIFPLTYIVKLHCTQRMFLLVSMVYNKLNCTQNISFL